MSTHDPTPTPLSRRRFLQLGGAAGAAAFLASSGAAGVAASSRRATAPVRTHAADQEASPALAADGAFRMARASWIGYIDIADDLSYPSLDRFTQDTGVVIDYEEAVNDNQEFFATDLQGPIAAGEPSGWDIVVLTDWMVQRLVSLGWLETMDTLPNYPANLEDVYRTRTWDPSNLLAAPYVSGMTGLGYDAKVTGPQSSLSALYTNAFAGRMTYLSEMNDAVGLAALYQGVDPSTLTQEQFDAAIALVKQNIDDGTVRQLTGNDYVEDMTNGDVVMAMAWSGDVAGSLAPLNDEGREFVWTLPDEGGMIWTDNMTIPKGAVNKAQAQTFIDWYYGPVNSAPIIKAVHYVCPVKGGAEALAAIDPEAAADPLIFPTEDMRKRLYVFVDQDPDTRAAWESAYSAVIGL